MSHTPPSGDRDFDAFCVNASARFSLTPTAYGLVAGQATSYAALTADFSQRLLAATEPSTRTAGTIAAKRVSKAALMALTKQFLRVARAHPGITQQQLADLGVRPVDPEPTPIPPPSTRPMISVDPDGLVRLVDETLPDRKAKPDGVLGALIFTKIDGEPPQDVDDAKFALLTTKLKCNVPVPASADGKKLYILARWYNYKGELGPVSAVAKVTVAA